MDQNLPDLDMIETMARDAIARFPAPFRPAAENVVVLVADLPPAHILQELGIDDPLDLTGLYEGIPLTEKSSLDQPLGPDTVWLFREPILAEWRDRGDLPLETLVAHVIVHEFAHHFGWSDEDIAHIDRWWE
ncbi:Predicted Zn-dependent protease, minimal metalloprotease (MMP)-like domain [Roseovarius azorensis]|uniref:Predicted Zn-dependent protease, minimal metalloprotease (MMP)-like domain n=1 Tax=Roseovarius azorensis TaxID=1287727 RepID=A0A1H7T2Q3_9RHOB|nr:metallopeptidase family protein [Roseovarius azorensis]SEL78805.1 Predicted Zn-dependent protease, minimal metalloprotease (MMP)-like domain [Roseovarius azorensis]